MKRLSILSLTLFCAASSWAQGPNETGNYYQAANGMKGAELKTALFQIISPHEVLSYTPGVWNFVNTYDIRPDGCVWDVYSNITNFTPVTDQDKGEEGSEGEKYNREHVVPKSWFNEDKNDTAYPMYTDVHHLFPTDRYVNSMRSNYPYGEVDKSLTPTKQSEGGFSKFGICDPSIGYTVVNGKARVFEPNDEYKGDLARACFYIATCYESYKNGNGYERSPEKWSSPMLASNIYPFFSEWALKMLLRWAQQDPVSEKEVNRNEGAYKMQKNRNPFVDYPGLEQYIWGDYMNVAFSYDQYETPSPSGIINLHYLQESDSDVIFDLRGQRVNSNQLKKGIYIRRGQKVVIR